VQFAPANKHSLPQLLLQLVMATLIGFLVIATVGAHVLGWRLVVVRSGSMGDRAPVGALALAGPTPGDRIDIGDLVVMTHPDSPTITHEVIDLFEEDDLLMAVTKGAANPDQDPFPYTLDGDAMTVRAIIPGAGRVVAMVRAYWLVLLLVMGAAVVLSGPDRSKQPAAQTRAKRRAAPARATAVRSPAI
jgi:signal peptidase I